MKWQEEYYRLCQAIDGVQCQLFKQGKRHNEFLQKDLVRLQNELWNLYLLMSGKILQEKPKVEGHRPERRDDI